MQDLINFFDLYFSGKVFPEQSVKFPKTNVYQKETGEVILEFGLAGYKKDDLEISVETKQGQNILTVQGKAERELEKGTRVITNTLPFRAFKQQFRLGDLIVDETETSFENGLLTIKLNPTISEKITIKL